MTTHDKRDAPRTQDDTRNPETAATPEAEARERGEVPEPHPKDDDLARDAMQRPLHEPHTEPEISPTDKKLTGKAMMFAAAAVAILFIVLIAVF